MKIEAFYISPGHDFFNRYGMERENHPVISQSSVSCVAGMGLEGDRFFGFKEQYKGQVTFFSAEVADSLREKLIDSYFDNSVFRRNIITRGIDLNQLIGKRFKINTIEFEGTQEAAPCDWMEVAVGVGARSLLAGSGGLRARILSSGTLILGKLDLLILD